MKFDEAKMMVKCLLEGVGVSVVYYIDDYQSFDGLEDISKYIEDNIPKHLDSKYEKIKNKLQQS